MAIPYASSHSINFLGDSDRRRPTALVTLSCYDLVVVCPQVHAQVGPRIEMVRCRDGTASAMRRANRPVLLESGSSLDRGSIRACCSADGVG